MSKNSPFVRSRLLVSILFAATLVGLVACGGPTTQTETILLNWGQALNAHLATGGRNSDYAYPKKGLDEIDPALTAGLSSIDAWGNELYYRRLRDDRYQLISRGEDGELGNDDDIILQNGAFFEAAKIYAERPIKK